MPLNIASAAILAIATSASLAVAAAWRRDQRRIYVFKPLTTLLIIAATLWCFAPAMGPYRNVILVGLALSLAGDVLLMLDEAWFLPGLGGFLAAQVVYAFAFTSGVGWKTAQLPWLVPFAFFALMVVLVLWQGLPNAAMRGAVVVYGAAIGVMAWRAAVRLHSGVVPLPSGAAALAGACLFLASDAVLAVARFRRPFRAAEPIVFATYWAAQLLIALSVRA
jgi:uncharacterized membrane protein YhhN